MKKYFLLFILFCVGGALYLSFPVNSPKGFVSIEDKKFKLNGKDFYPVAVNYIAGLYMNDAGKMWPGPGTSYNADSLRPIFTEDSCIKILRADMELIKQMGFNTVRIVGIGEEVLDDEGEQLRMELEERLRAYAGIKVAGGWLAEREAAQALLFGRPGSELPPPDEIPLEDLSIHLIERAYRKLLEVARAKRDREVEPEPPSVLERMSRLTELLRHTWSLLFSAVVGKEPIRTELVVTLLALLELCRLGQAKMRQSELFGEIVIEQGQSVKSGE